MDALSRMHDNPELHSLVNHPKWLEGKEVLLKGIIAALCLQKRESTRPGFVYLRGVLFYEDRLVLAAYSSGSQNCCWNFIHLQSGHSGFYCTYRRVVSNIYWVHIITFRIENLTFFLISTELFQSWVEITRYKKTYLLN